VFPDRYHAEIITSPRQARHALRYVMLNWRRHEEDRVAPMRDWNIDWFSSAAMFPDWTEYGDEGFCGAGRLPTSRCRFSSHEPGFSERAGKSVERRFRVTTYPPQSGDRGEMSW
jgi:hypothetical protein